MILQKLKQAAEEYLGQPVSKAGDHGAGVLQRRAAAGDQDGRPDRRPRGHAHRQRADRGGAGLRPRQEKGRDDRGVRLRRRHLRHLHPRSRRRPWSRSRRPTATPTSAATTSTSASSTGLFPSSRASEGIDLGKDRMALQRPEGVGGEGEDGALHGDGDRHQPAVITRRRDRPEATCR